MGDFLKSHSAAEFEKPRQKKVERTGFVLVEFAHTEIDLVRQISETGYYRKSMVPMIRQKTELLIIPSDN